MEPSTLWHLGSWTFRGTTLVWTWIAMLVILALFFVASRGANVERPTRLQNLLEFVFDFVNGFLSERLEEEDKRHRLYYLLVAVFMFVLVSNLVGLFPLFRSPTSDANTTVGLALIVFMLIHYYGVRYRGVGGHISSFFKPIAFLVPINILEALSNPMTLALRLFGNIFAGDVILSLGTSAAPITMTGVGSAVAFVASMLIQLLAFSFNTFVDLVQSFIFMVLTLTYVAGSMGPAGEH